MARKAKEAAAPTLSRERAMELLARQLEQCEEMAALDGDDPAVKQWLSTTEAILAGAFGQPHEMTERFRRRYGTHVMGVAAEHHEAMRERRAVLESCLEQLRLLAPEERAEGAERPEALGTVLRICERFHAVSLQLLLRRARRPTLEVDDEYDVQDLMHALLRMHFDDIRAEEWTPSYAGGAARMDFLLKREQIVVEAKMARMGLGAKEVSEQLILDAARYRAHPDCKKLVCFVYDPRGVIRNPDGVERDLSGLSGAELEVRCLIKP